MKYFVIWHDGQKFGPADIATLNQWIGEGRVSETTELESVDTGARCQASTVPGLVFATAAPTAGAPVGDPLIKEPTPTGQPTAAPFSPGPYANPPTPGSPYPRGGYGYSPGVVPDELRGGFNFGAFALHWIWGLNHKAYITLISLALGVLGFVPYLGCLTGPVGLGLMIWYGIKGNEWAWQSGRFATPEDCKACQKVWMIWGIVIFILTVVLVIGAVVAGVAALGMASQQRTFGQ